MNELAHPFVSVIMVSYNSDEDIADCLDSLLQQSYKNFTIICVDNNSSDKTLQIIKNNYSKVQLIQNSKNLGFAKACNMGIERAFENKETKYVVCLNVDTTVDENWLKELVTVAENNTAAGSIQSKILLYGHHDKINTAVNKLTFLGFGYCGDYLQPSSARTRIESNPYSSGSSVLFSREALEKSGLFDEDYFLYHEDVDLGLRIQLYGHENLLAPRSICYHKYSFPKDDKVYFLERNRLITLYKNFTARTFLLIFPAFVIKEIGLFFFLLFTGNLFQKLKSYFYILTNIRKIHYKRNTVQKKRSVSDKQIARSLTGTIKFQELDIYFLRKLANPFFNAYWEVVRKLIK